MTFARSEKISASNQPVESMPGTLSGVIDWHVLDRIWHVIQHSE